MKKPVIYYTDGYKYQLAENYPIWTHITGHNFEHDFFQYSDNGLLLIKKGYSWDGATWAYDSKNFMRGSLVHDVFYQMIAEKLLPEGIKVLADKLLVDICKEDGMGWFRRWYVYRAVRLNPRPDDKPILSAP